MAANPAKWDGPVSDELSGKTKSLGKLATPTLSATDRTDTAITLNWDAGDNKGVSAAISYTLYRSESSISDIGASGVRAATLSTGPHKVSGLKAATTYHFKIVATATGYDKGVSSELSASTRLPVPTGLSPAVDATTITLTWNAVAGADGYGIEQKKEGGAFTALTSPSPTGSSSKTLTIDGLDAYTIYYFRVTAKVGSDTPKTSLA
ncbi:MAG: fibronectin type III domain-containing protein, partial [Spirochaetota bacterium]